MCTSPCVPIRTAATSSRNAKTPTHKEHAPAIPFPLGPDTREDQGLPPTMPTNSKTGRGRGRGEGGGMGRTAGVGNGAGNGPGNGLRVFGDGGDGQDMDSRVKVTHISYRTAISGWLSE